MADDRVRTPGVVHVIGLSWTCLLLLWVIVLPSLDGPDEVASLDLVIDATSTSPLQWQRPFTQPIDGRLLGVAEQLASPDGLAITAEVPALSDLAPTSPEDAEALANPRSADPPLGYRLLGLGLALTPGWADLPLDQLLRGLRLVSVLAVAPLPWLLARIAAVLNGRESVIVASAVGTFTFPQLAIQGATAGTAPLMVLLGAVALLLLARLAVGTGGVRLQRRTGVLLTLVALVHPWGPGLLVGLLGVLAIRRRAGDRTAGLVEIAGGVLLPVLALGWWYGVNSATLGTVQPVRSSTALWPDALRQIVVGMWGRTASADGAGAAVPVAIAGTVSILLLVAAVTAVRGRGLGAALLLGGPAAVGLAMAVSTRPAAGSLPLDGPDAGMSTADAVAGLGAEALLVGLPGLLLLIAVGLQRGLPARFQPWSWVPPLLAGVVLHALLLSQLVSRRWADGQDGVVDGLSRVIGRSPVGVEALAGIVLGLLFGLVVAVVLMSSRARRLVIVDADAPTGAPPTPERQQSGTDHEAEDRGDVTS